TRRPWAGEEKLIGGGSAANAATGKLLANLALSVTAQGVLEALNLGEAEGLAQDEILQMLDMTGLAFMKNMLAPFIVGECATSPGDFTAYALCKDTTLMAGTANVPLPAVEAAIQNFERQQELGHGDEDFPSIFVYRKD